jgi:hypothetical protein
MIDSFSLMASSRDCIPMGEFTSVDNFVKNRHAGEKWISEDL